MVMLAYCHRLFVNCFLGVWCLSWIFKTCERFACCTRFGFEWDAIARPALFAVLICCLLLCRIRFEQHQPLYADSMARSVVTQIFRNSCVLGILRGATLITGSCILLFFSIVFAWYGIGDAGKSLACATEYAGDLELAERIYQRSPHQRKFSSLAVWKSLDKREDEVTIRKRNRAVAIVYGMQSHQMADRFLRLGLLCEEFSNDLAYQWLNKSLAIYQSHHATSKSIDTLCQMAIIRSTEGDKIETKRLLDEAAVLFPQKDEPLRYCSSNLLSALAKDQDNIEQAQLFGVIETIPEPADCGLNLDFWTAQTLLLLLAAFVSGSGFLLCKELVLSIVGTVLERRFRSSSDVQSTMNWLNKLVTLNLYKRNNEVASVQSEQLVALAESQSCVIDQRRWIASRSARNRISAIIGHELFCACFATIVIGSFYW